MSWLYMTEPGSRLSKRGGQYVISRENETLCEVPAAVLEGVTLIDSIQVSSSAMVDFLERGIPVTWISSSGRFFGRLESTSNWNVMKQQEQFRRLEDKDFQMALAKRIIFCKIYNQRTILRSYNRRIQNKKIEKAIADIRILADKLHTADSVEGVMGYEGAMARIYFQAMGLIVNEDFHFEKRTRRPPKDPFNSLLSFGYTLLLYDFYTAITNCGLHPYMGFLHTLKNGHPALASDLMEPWRPAIVDALCLSLVTKHEIKKEHFQKGENEGIYLDRVGRRIFIQAYEKKMRSVNHYFDGGYSWRHTIEMECRSYNQALHSGNMDDLKPMVIR